MPRRPSASVGTSHTSTPNASSILVHRTTESHHGFASVTPSLHHHSLQTLGSSATPQQKNVQVLVNRLKHKLPCNSGVSLDRVESDRPTQQAIETLVELSKDSLDMIAWALCELLDRLAKQTDSQSGHLTIEVLQSQLFILKVLSMTMASRWSQTYPSRAYDESLASPDSPLPSGSSRSSKRQAPSVYSTAPSWQEPPPLDDSCVKYILSVMVLFMRQTSSGEIPLMLQTRSTDIGFRDFEDNMQGVDVKEARRVVSPVDGRPASGDIPLRNQPSSNSFKSGRVSIKSTMHISATNTAYEMTHMSLVKAPMAINNAIAKYVGRIIFHISASNWNVVFERLSTKITFLAAHPEATADLVDLQLMSHSVLDRQRLVHLLNQLSSLLVNMRKEAQLAIAGHLRSAVWNWIDVFPGEFNEAIRTRGKTEGAPERVFDLLYSMVPAGSEKIFWPTLMILNCITADRISPDFQFGSATPKSRKEIKFMDTVVKSVGSNTKLSEVALACVVDFCRAAAYIETGGDVPLRIVAADIAHEIKSVLYNYGPSRKPFWESPDDIDVALYADALVAVFRFLSLEDSTPLFQACVEPERSDAVKTSVIRACVTLVNDTPRFQWQKPLNDLEFAIAGRCRDVLKGAGTRRQEVEHNGVVKRVASRPKGKQIYPEPLSEREVLILGILSLWRSTPLFFLKGINTMEEIDNWVAVAVKIWEAPIDVSVKISTASCMRKVSEHTFMTPATDPNYRVMMDIVKSSLPVTLLSVVGNLLLTRVDLDSQRLWVSIAHQVIDVYVTKSDLEHVQQVQTDPRRIPAFALAEIAFLVSLTSADNDISQMAARGLRLVAYAERQPNAPPNTAITSADRAKRYPIYEQLGDPRITVAGRLGHQKRIRKLVRQLTFSAGTHLVVWEECYWRWRGLNESINNAVNEAAAALDGGEPPRNHVPLAQQEVRFQWQNLTLFLAALGGSCIQDNQDMTALSKVIPAKYLPDKLRVASNPLPLVESFIGDLMALLVAGDMQIRDIVRDALGSELSPRLYPKLIKNLEETIHLLEDSSESSDIESFAIVLDQIMSILKLVADNSEATLEDVMNVDISSTMIALASFIARSSASSAHRIKIKFCVLCESVCNRTDTLTIRKDSHLRHEILNHVLQWMVPVTSATDQSHVTLNELNIACLRAAVKLLERLELKAVDPSNAGDDALHVVSRLFNKYSSALLASIECVDISQLDNMTSDSVSDMGSIHQKMRASQKEAELRELIITGLTHLVSANSESGFKQCLPLAYDPDSRKRTIFAHVFARVIGQGTVFDPEDKTVTKARHVSLCELVRGSDMVLAMTICEICPPAEVEIMISVLLNIFDSRPALMGLIKLMIEREVAQTDNEASLFRSNSTCTRFLSAFARLHGYHYLRGLVNPLLESMVQMPPGTGYEIDPNKAVGQDVVQNQKNVEYIAANFLQLMSASLPTLPGMFREICAHIAKVVAEVWPEAKYAAMGAFIFLRFISPAVVTPETIDIEVPKGDNSLVLRRGLMVIAKIIQNLANNIFFGKEAHMTTLNKFLEGNIANVTRFLSELHKHPVLAEESSDVWLGITSDDTDVVVLHRFFHKHADKIGKELLSLSKPSVEGESSAVSGKRAWDGLCALLVDLGPPMDVPQLSQSDSSQHRDYIELMAKCANRSTTSVEHLFLETDVQESTAVFVLRLSRIDVESIDIELFMYHILKTLTSDLYRTRSFDIVLDCTGFTATSEVPLQWLKYCAELIPKDTRVRFSATRILNPNTLTQKYLRRLYNISAGTPLSTEIKAYTSVLQLMEDVRTTALAPLAYPVSLEQEANETFYDVQMRTTLRVPVIMRVGSSHIRVTSVKSLPISPGVSCKSTDLIPLTDVSDIYNVSTGQEANEFIIRRRQGVTVYFSSPSREQIVKYIRSCKGKLKEAQAPLTERFSRFSNVPATLLHIGFLSVDLNDEELRGAAYDLLGAVCTYLKYDKSPIVAPKAGFISGDPVAFVANLSEKLAEFAPQLTLDFIHEVSAAMTSMDKNSVSQRIGCLQYMSPWIQNLSHFANSTHTLYERSGARLRDCIRTLSDLSLAFPEMNSTIQKHIWAEVAKLDSNIVDIILDELIRTATDGGIGTRRCETISHIVAALSSINVRGRIYSKLRKALSKVSPKASNTLMEHQNWNEISTLIRLTLVVGSQSTQPGTNYLYVPEVVHLVSLIAGEGPTLVRKSVYGIIINLLQSLYIGRQDDTTESALMQLINDCTLPESLKLFGLRRETPTSEYTNLDPFNEKDTLDTYERLVQLLLRILDVSAGSPGLLNVWKARWMSLVTATAFQQSPAVQTRSFVALAALAIAEVDDDFLYQILVAFKSALMKANETNTMAIVSMLRCMSKIVPAIVDTSRYITVLFWLAVALLEASHLGFYIEALSLLRVTLDNMEQQGMFKVNSVQVVLMEAREQLEDVTSQLDEMLRISFETSFSFSLAAIIFKGMRHSGLKDSAEAALRTLLRVTSGAQEEMVNGFKQTVRPEALGYFVALLPVSTTPRSYKCLLNDAHIEGAWATDAEGDDEDSGIPDLGHLSLGIHDSMTALLVASFIGTILASAQGDDSETQILYGLLSSLAMSYPEIISITYETIQDRVREVFANSSNASIIRSVSTIFRVALQDPVRSSNASTSQASTSTLSVVEENSIGPGRSHLNALEDLGMQGLANNFQFLPPGKGHSTKMINWIPGLITLMIS
ncbi:hypothetical protein GALMADRAFT_87191 [Galerina marginata CBS 339.88]|uniref:Ras-GAP domain-containing protein n=1 Tax=Galerina marginata (strain CBS 339.88) TaxID=685588 RepID=A0A067TYY7_GALM3|nr:hypothetical protein GALMADRAFT_87191 [Galerina marginata CBS 339.88]